MMDTTHQNLKLMSHSSDSLLDCMRKYQIYKLRPTLGSVEYEEGDYHLSFGSTVGVGIAEYLKESSIDAAYWAMFLEWNRHLFDEEGKDKKKTFGHCLMAVDRFKLFHMEEFRGYELVSFNGVPATEVGFSIDCGDGFYYRGKLDALLYNKLSSSLVPLEIKTTGSYNIHEAMYKNQGQGSGYKLVVDAVSKLIDIELTNKFKVIYGVYQTKAQEWHRFDFTKSNANLTRWVKNLLVNKQKIQQASIQNFFPMNGNMCFSFSKPCKYFGICDMQDEILFGNKYSKVEVKDIEKDKLNYEFQFKLEALIHMLMMEE